METAANQWTRRFDLSGDHGVTAPVLITGVDFGVESAGGPRGEIAVNVLLRTIPKSAPLTWETAPVIYNVEFLVQADQPKIVHVDMGPVAISPAVDDLVVEVAARDGTLPPWLGSYFFIGANTAPESRPSYWSAPGCGFGEPVPLASVGMGIQRVVMTVYLSDLPVSTVPATWGRLKALYR